MNEFITYNRDHKGTKVFTVEVNTFLGPKKFSVSFNPEDSYFSIALGDVNTLNESIDYNGAPSETKALIDAIVAALLAVRDVVQ